MANNIIDFFNQYFEVIPATTDELKNEVFKLRYQVFCVETQIFNPDEYPDQLEIDIFDQRAVHYLIRHRQSGAYAASTRFILPDANNPEQLFPLELHCKIDNLEAMQAIDRRSLGEASRLCVSKTFKKRKNEEHSLINIDTDWKGHFTPQERRVFPHISFALIACMIKACHNNNIEYAFSTLEPAWYRLLSSSGIHFTKIGPLVDYSGLRWPGLIKVTDLLNGVAEKNMDIWNLLTNKGRY